MSAPAQKALGPAPVMIKARVGQADTSRSALSMSLRIAKDNAFSASGRLRVKTANSSRRVNSTVMPLIQPVRGNELPKVGSRRDVPVPPTLALESYRLA